MEEMVIDGCNSCDENDNGGVARDTDGGRDGDKLMTMITMLMKVSNENDSGCYGDNDGNGGCYGDDDANGCYGDDRDDGCYGDDGVMRRMVKCDDELVRGHYGDDDDDGRGDSDDRIADDGGDHGDNNGVNTITTLMNKKAQLVMTAHDGDPVELAVFLPALHRKMGVPDCIIGGRQDWEVQSTRRPESLLPSHRLTQKTKDLWLSRWKLSGPITRADVDKICRHWGGSVLGSKSVAYIAKLEKAKVNELAT
ncbi:hypothetical protein P7K49_021891 [Saguinus oedipus]|uniref:Uncharacterized protein n=1 Tax=Saguinus oedipus TaxID=9490 RepID=A0ABQ9UTX9_SAGOE|nr:hypothetical protein P7K49_021891 [Saguinus oedipus]